MIKTLLRNIKSAILSDGNFQSCLVYPNARGEVVAPAVFLDVANYSPGDDPATDELSLVATIEARVVVDSISEDAELVCQNLAQAVANLAYLNSFGSNVAPAKIVGISRDAFKPEFDAYICWLVEWRHEFHLGESVWNESGLPPHTIYIGESVNG